MIKNKNNKYDRTLKIVVASFLMALTFNLFLRPNNIIIGGTGGLALIINKYFEVGIPVIIAFLSLFLYTIAYIFLSKKVVFQTLIASIAYPLFVYLTYNIGDYLDINHNELVVITLFSGIIYGFSEGLVSKTGLLSGGTATLARIISDKLKITKTISTLFIEGAIILVGAYVFGYGQMMYGVVIYYLMNLISSKVTLDISKRKMFYIYTDDIKEIKNFIHCTLGYDVTTMVNEQATKHHNYILMTIVKTSDYYALKEGIEDIDPHAKIIIFDSYEFFEKDGKIQHCQNISKEIKHENF